MSLLAFHALNECATNYGSNYVHVILLLSFEHGAATTIDVIIHISFTYLLILFTDNFLGYQMDRTVSYFGHIARSKKNIFNGYSNVDNFVLSFNIDSHFKIGEKIHIIMLRMGSHTDNTSSMFRIRRPPSGGPKTRCLPTCCLNRG